MKSFLLFIFFLLFFLETGSYLLTKFEIFHNYTIPSYSKFDIKGNYWRNESLPWGAWHKVSATSSHKDRCINTMYQSNDIGARDDKDYLSLKNKNNTILLGDSFAEGYGVDIEDTFPKIIEKFLQINVLNLGTAGNFGPLQEYLLYSHYKNILSHQRVILFILPANDFIDNDPRKILGKRYRPYFYKNPKNENEFDFFYPINAIPSANYFPSGKKEYIKEVENILVNYTYFANFLREVIFIFNNYKKYNSLYAPDKKKEGYFFTDKYAIDGTIFYIDKIARDVHENKKDLTIVIIPTLDDINQILETKKKYQDYYWYKQIVNIEKKYRTKIIDLAADNNYFIDKSMSWKNNYLSCDGHWSKQGHFMAAQKFIDHFNKY
jgi:hypothetical protein